VHDFTLNMHTNFNDIDFAEDTLSPTSKQLLPGLGPHWHFTNLISGFRSADHAAKAQPGPLAGEISYFAPVSLFFFFFLMFIIH